MKNFIYLGALLSFLSSATWAKALKIHGDYLEVRTCNVYAGSCFVNGEMGLTGKEAILVWSIQNGSWKGTQLDGLKVLAVVAANETLGNQQIKPVGGQAVIVADKRADAAQKAALADLARSLAGKLIKEVVKVESSDIQFGFEAAGDRTTATVKAGKLVEITTIGISAAKTPCGFAEIYYPPLTDVVDARAGYTSLAAYRGSGLDRTWEASNLAGTYVAKFSH